MKPHLTWKTEAYDYAGNVIGTISKTNLGGIVFDGTADALALCLPDLRQVSSFFTDPDTLAHAAYEEFIGLNSHKTFATWEEMKHNESQRPIIALWKRIAQAVLSTPTTSSSK